jgi:hypothetical protein
MRQRVAARAAAPQPNIISDASYICMPKLREGNICGALRHRYGPTWRKLPSCAHVYVHAPAGASRALATASPCRRLHCTVHTQKHATTCRYCQGLLQHDECSQQASRPAAQKLLLHRCNAQRYAAASAAAAINQLQLKDSAPHTWRVAPHWPDASSN